MSLSSVSSSIKQRCHPACSWQRHLARYLRSTRIRRAYDTSTTTDNNTNYTNGGDQRSQHNNNNMNTSSTEQQQSAELFNRLITRTVLTCIGR